MCKNKEQKTTRKSHKNNILTFWSVFTFLNSDLHINTRVDQSSILELWLLPSKDSVSVSKIKQIYVELPANREADLSLIIQLK